jgi:hypothetical protein
MNNKLREDERRLIDYHRSNLTRGGLKNGNKTTTFRGTRIDFDDGTMYAPTYFNGKVHQNMDDIVSHAKKTGLYAMYPNAKEANDAEFKLHEIMRLDTQKYEEAKRPPLSQLLGVMKTITK